jgi:hypothetical protein
MARLSTGVNALMGALDTLICSEKGSPLRSTGLPERFIAALALAGVVVA